MKDMLGTPITVGAIVLWPGGSARYGGLKMVVGVVTKMTEKRCTCAWTHLDDPKKIKNSSKTGAKITVCDDTVITQSAAVKTILDALGAE